MDEMPHSAALVMIFAIQVLVLRVSPNMVISSKRPNPSPFWSRKRKGVMDISPTYTPKSRLGNNNSQEICNLFLQVFS